MSKSPHPEQDTEAQDNFVEVKEPSELIFCLLLASAYLGLAKFCLGPLYLTNNWKLLVNVEGFFITVALVAILIALRPYTAPSRLQLSSKGIKYRGPYWIQRKTVNWEQVSKVYLSPELILVLYKPNPASKKVWFLAIMSIYLSEREQVVKSFLKFCPIKPLLMKGPNMVSRIMLTVALVAVIVWFCYLLIP